MFRRIPYPIAVVALHLLLLVPALPVAAVTGSPVDAHGVKPRDFGSRGTHEATTADAKATSPARAPVATSATSVSSLNTLANEKVCLAPGDQTNVQMLADGQGGAIIVWQDPRAGQWDIYAQRVDAFGQITEVAQKDAEAAGQNTKGSLAIVEIEIYEPVK